VTRRARWVMLKPMIAVLQVLDATVQTLVLSLEASQAAAAAAVVSGAALQRMLDGVSAPVVVLPVEVRAGSAPPSGRGSSTRSPRSCGRRQPTSSHVFGEGCVPIEPEPKPLNSPSGHAAAAAAAQPAVRRAADDGRREIPFRPVGFQCGARH
jgi:hypothetical protein